MFRTEDGVDIFKGEHYYWVNKCTFFLGEGEAKGGPKNEKFADFKSKQKAEEYILMNKPSLSLSDVKNIWVWSTEIFPVSLWEKLKEKAQSKLKI